jgi:hypothetical protein
MTFQQRRTLAMTAILVLLFGWYFAIVLGQLASTPASEIGYRGLMIPAVLLLVVLAVVVHTVLAIGAPAEAVGDDERDRLVALRGHRIARYVLAVAAVAGLGLAMVEADAFWIAQVLLAGLVVAEITEGLTRLVAYRRGV